LAVAAQYAEQHQACVSTDNAIAREELSEGQALTRPPACKLSHLNEFSTATLLRTPSQLKCAKGYPLGHSNACWFLLPQGGLDGCTTIPTAASADMYLD
jgi:hypothetical protein